MSETGEGAATEVPRLSASIANILVTRSALHAYDAHRLLGGNRKEATKAMETGKLLEKFVLGADLDKLVIVDADSWRGKEAQAARAKAEEDDLQAVFKGDYEEAQETAKRIVAQFEAEGFDLRSATGQAQVRVEWESHEGVLCSGVIDWLDLKRGIIIDFKTTNDASDQHIQRSIFQNGYDIQAQAYEEAVTTLHPELAGRLKTFFLFAETATPYAVNPVQLAGSMAELGRRKWQRAKDTWAECLRSGVWPGYARKDKRIEATAWQLSAEMEMNLAGGDFQVVQELGGLKS